MRPIHVAAAVAILLTGLLIIARGADVATTMLYVLATTLSWNVSGIQRALGVGTTPRPWLSRVADLARSAGFIIVTMLWGVVGPRLVPDNNWGVAVIVTVAIPLIAIGAYFFSRGVRTR